MRRVAPDLPIPGAVGVAIVSSVYLSAHLVDVVARLTGFGPSAVIGSVLLLAVATVVVARVEHRWLAPFERPTLAGVRATLRDDAAAWLLALAVGSLVAIVLFGNGWRETPDGWVSGWLGLERPARPRRDRLEHPPRQLPARGAVLRRASH